MKIYAIELSWHRLYPFSPDKYRVWEITALVQEKKGYRLNYEHKLNKTIRRKKEEDMLKIVEKWYKDYTKQGYKVLPGLGNTLKFMEQE